MKNISSYEDLVRRKKEIQLQKAFLWDEIAHLHQSSEEGGSSYWVQRLLTVDPAVIIQTWNIAVKLGNYFRKSTRKSND